MEKENISTLIEPKSGELDATDIKILTCLQDNSRLTTKELAAKVHLSTTPVFERQKRLEREGYIKKYIAVLDPEKLNLGFVVFCCVKLCFQPDEFFTSFKRIDTHNHKVTLSVFCNINRLLLLMRKI